MAGEQEFGVSFKKSAEELQRLTTELSMMGKDLDGLEAKTGSLSKAYSRHLNRMEEAQTSVNRSLIKMGLDAEKASTVSEAAFKKSTQSLISMAQASTNAAAKADALRHRKSELANQLNQMAKDQEYTRWQQKIAAMYAKTRGETRYLKKRLEELDGAQGRHNARLKATLAAKQRMVKADAEQAARLEELKAEYTRLNSAQALEVEALKLQIKERRKHVQELAREKLGLNTAATAQNKKAESEERSSRVIAKLTSNEARYEARLERGNKLLELRNKQTTEYARASALLTDAQARQARQMERNIELYKRQATYAAMTNAQLLGFAGTTDRVSREMHMSAQAAAMFRAGLGGLNASIGIYTSGTIAAAAATYAMAAALRETVSAGMDFTEMMSRAEAVMMSGTDSLTSAGDSMQALEMQVRSLGQSTVFTATEVSEGLVDLGMAGLSASQAMRALKPSLDLASIGGIDMGKSADIATNVMTAFKLEAGDLAGVVDMLATAVTNSNTTIEQLANALSYVGPAAQAAGFDLKDTVAAIELLSNAGIKSSKAGTGLRRFMLNIQNPTSKGAAVLEEYNIGLQDATGNTRDLIDILGQFNTALHNDGITPSERMAAVVDLVGVRAASAVSRMISSVDELGTFRRGLEDAAGAAEEMRQKIEDNLTADWKQVKSSFQELQLEVFQEFQWHLRTTSAQLTQFFQSLTTESADGVTKLDEVIGTMTKFGNVAKELIIGIAAFKGLKVISTFSGAAAASLSALSDRMSILHARTSGASASQNLLSMAFNRVSLGAANAWRMTQAYAASVWYAGSVTERLAAMANWATAALHGLTRAAALLARALGWVGMIWGIYSAIKTTFSSTDSYIDAHKDRIGGLKDEYKRLGEEIEITQRKKNRAAIEAQRDADAKELSAVDDQIVDLNLVRENATNPDIIQALDDRLYMLRQKAEGLQQSFTDATGALTEMATSQEELASVQKTFDGWTSALAEAEREIQRLSDLSTTDSLSGLSEQRNQRDAWKEMRQVAEGYLFFTNFQMKELEETTANYVDTLNDALDAQSKTLQEDRRFDQLSVTQQMIEKQRELSGVKQEMEKMDDSGAKKSLDRYKRLEESALNLQEEIYDLKWEYQDLAEEGSESHKELLDVQNSETKSIQQLRTELASLNAERMSMTANSVVTGESADVELFNEKLVQSIEIAKEINAQVEENQKKLRAATQDSVEAYQELLDAQDQEEENLDSLKTSLAGVNAERMAMLATMVVSGDEATPESIERVSELLRQQATLQRDIFDLQEENAKDLANAQGDSADAYERLLELQREDKRTLKDLRQELAALNAQRLGMIASTVVSGGDFSTEEIELITTLMKEQAGVMELINEKQEENNQGREKARDDEARAHKERMKQAKSLLETLRGDFDPMESLLRKHKDQMAMLDSLRNATGENAISQEDYNLAVGELSRRLREATLEQNEYYQSLKDLREEYLKSPFEDTVDDLAKLNKLLENAAISLEEYGRIADRIESSQRDQATSGMPEPKVQGLGGASSSPFGEYISSVSTRADDMAKFGERSSELDDSRALNEERINLETEQRIAAMEAEVKDREEHAQRLKNIKQDEKRKLLAVEQEYSTQSAALLDKQAEYSKTSAEMVKISMVSSLSDVFGMVAKAGEDATTAQKIAFAAQKALTVAQILMYTHLAAARAPAEAGPIMGIPLSTAIMAQGYASAGLVGGLAIAEMSGAYEGGSSGGGNFAGQYDSGGTIPRGSYGIVGEVGPEIVHGPANVTGRRATERQRKENGGNHIEFKPLIQVTVGDSDSKENPEETGRAIGKVIEAKVMNLFQREMKPNGVLDRWKRS